jgi:rhamnosyltransferase
VAVSVAIPVRNGGARLREVLEAVRGQTVQAELLVADSRSTDGSRELAVEYGAAVFDVDRFSHGGTRNELLERASGEHVAFLTQDAVPADERWLEKLLAGFALAPDVALVYGPSHARLDAPVSVAREQQRWFASLSPDGRPRIDRDRDAVGPGAVTFFTSSNCAVSRALRFPEVEYAEDQALALAALHAGRAKAFLPDAAVIHSHDYGPVEQFRRAYDEWRALYDVYGFIQPLNLLDLQAQIRADVRAGAGPLRALRHHTVRTAGALAARAFKVG